MAKKNRRRNRLIILAIIILIIVGGIVGKQSGLLWKEPLDGVVTERPVVREIVESISANGRVQPVVEVKISPDVSGEIVELNVKEGDQVKRGDLLIKIKPDTYQSMQERATASVNSSRAQLEQTRAQLALALQTYERQKQLYQQRAISESDYQSAEAQYEGLKAQERAAEFNIKSAEASLREADENLYKTTIFAPGGGTISKLNVELGERVVGTATMAGTEMLRMADLSEMEVRADVNENDIVRVELGDTATIEIDAYLGRKFSGIVSRIANSAQGTGTTTSSDQVTNFEVRIYILPESYAEIVQHDQASPFRPGMSATVEIRTDTRRVLSVPIQAITTRSPMNNAAAVATTTEAPPMAVGGDKQEVIFVYKADSSRVIQVPVTTGIQDKQYIEIAANSAVDTTSEVVVAPFMAISKKLQHGQQVQHNSTLGAGVAPTGSTK